MNVNPVTKPDKAGRMRAERAFPPQPCAVCGAPYSKTGSNVGRHHADGDRLNNTPENIVFLCKPHHVEAHRALDGKVGGGPRPRIAAMMRDRALARARQAAVMRDHGASVDEVAREMGVNPQSVVRWIRKYGCIFAGCVSMDAHWHGPFPGGSRHVVVLEPAIGRTSFSRGSISGGAIVATASWRDRRTADKRFGHHGPKVKP